VQAGLGSNHARELLAMAISFYFIWSCFQNHSGLKVTVYIYIYIYIYIELNHLYIFEESSCTYIVGCYSASRVASDKFELHINPPEQVLLLGLKSRPRNLV